jgi:hypothetical protein
VPSPNWKGTSHILEDTHAEFAITGFGFRASLFLPELEELVDRVIDLISFCTTAAKAGWVCSHTSGVSAIGDAT